MKTTLIKGGILCRFCRAGRLCCEQWTEFNPRSGPPIVGPGSKSQFYTKTSEYFCDHCGLLFKKSVIDAV